jgi:hypothetical protein
MVDFTKVTTVAEPLKHPSYPDATWNLQPTRSGRLPVAAGRGGPLRIGWEVHGEGPIKIIVSRDTAGESVYVTRH